MSTAAIRDRLRQAQFLEGMTDSALHQLAKLVTLATYECDEIVFEEGAPRQFMAIIISGAIAIEKGRTGRPIRLVTLGAGQSLGEGLLLDESPHGTSARTVQRTEAYVVSADTVREMLKEYPALYAALVGRAARSISQRLAATDATLVGHGRTLGFTGARTRPEHDLLGDRDVPEDALYGIQTLRAMENFPITGTALREFPVLIEALAAVKEAAALANAELGLLDSETADLIVRASQELRAGRHHEHFVVDMIQGGAGTSTNMNANEVIANRALELKNKTRGDYVEVHPNNHVNLSQSTNDVYPTAVKIALHRAIEALRIAMAELAAAFLAKGEEFSPHLKMGRTQLQDAVPMTLGQEFTAFGHTILEDVDRLGEAQALIREINMGATAIGTGINAPLGYAATVCRELSRITGLSLITAPDLVEATADTGSFVQLSGVLKRCAVKLSKICNDLRLLSSGPRAGLGEINLPAMQPGSSIMPGKVNPVIPEVVNQVCFDIIGGDVTVTMAAEAGQLQLNVFEPIIAYRLLRSIETLANSCKVLRERCVTGITPNPARMRQFVEMSIGIVTALVPTIGYEKATSVAKEALETGRGVLEVVLARGLMTRDQLDRALDPETMTGRTTLCLLDDVNDSTPRSLVFRSNRSSRAFTPTSTSFALGRLFGRTNARPVS
jgi:aspartate ammonia-lyase